MPVWSPQGQHVERLRQGANAAAANAAAPAPGPVDDWMRRFGAQVPAPAPAPANAAHIHNWRQNFAPGDFLPYHFDLEDLMRRTGLGANQHVPRQPIVAAANPAPVFAPVIVNPLPAAIPLAPSPLAGQGNLRMDEFLRLYPHIGVRPNPPLPVLVRPVGFSIHACDNAPRENPLPGPKFHPI